MLQESSFFQQTIIIAKSFEEDFLSWQKSLAYSLRIFPDNFSLLSPPQWLLATWLKIFNEFAIHNK